jgi:hypothetical protein
MWCKSWYGFTDKSYDWLWSFYNADAATVAGSQQAELETVKK